MEDNYKLWYEEAICASNDLGFAGMSATDVILYLAEKSEKLKLDLTLAEDALVQKDFIQTENKKLRQTLENILDWPCGGSKYGQDEIKKFVKNTLEDL